MGKFDYVTIGHISEDVNVDGNALGGAVSFAGLTARALGCKTAVLTSAAADFDFTHALPDLTVHHIPADATTTFTNVYSDTGRQQTLHARAAQITVADLPDGWERAAIAHFAPIADEIDVEMVQAFSGAQICLTPQGWLRGWDENGRVSPIDWEAARAILPLAAAVITSEEDVPSHDTITLYKQYARLLVVTDGAKGCTVFMNGEERHFTPPPVTGTLETTGAGDIFSASFFVRLHQTGGNPWEAARFANQMASRSVMEHGIEAKIKRIEQELQAGKRASGQVGK